LEPDVERFVDWLCRREHEVVGYPGTCYRSPLALWLSQQTGHVYGIDEGRYGRASQDFRFWRPLPRWAQAFASWIDTCSATTYVLTGAEAFWVLARVEATLGPLVV
jgi:hypothetical protein